MNALVRLAQLSRGRYQEMIAAHGQASHAALEERLDAMAKSSELMSSRRAGSTNYRDSSAITAISNCLVVANGKQTEQPGTAIGI